MNNIKDLQLFLAVVEMESITQAAKQIGYTDADIATFAEQGVI